MELYSPAPPRIAYIGAPAAPGAQALGWLAQQCEVRSFPEDGIDAAMRDLGQIHVLLLDAHSIDAHLICQQLRQAEPSRPLPVLGLGHRLPSQDVIRLLGHGAVDVVALPTDQEVLLAKILALAYRQAEIMMTRAINRTLIQNLEGLRAALQSRAHALPGKAGDGRAVASLTRPASATPFGTDGKQLLEQLERRARALPDHVALYVISALASTELLPLNLSSLILNLLTRRVPLARLGPVHHAFADLVKRHMTTPPLAMHTAELAMLQACDASGPAVEALRFVVDLPTLLHPPSGPGR